MSDIPYKSPATPMSTDKDSGSLTRLGGGIGIAGSVVGLLIFIGACAGFDASLKFSFLPVVLGLPGLILAIMGGVFQKNPADTHVMGAMFAAGLSLIGGIVEMAAWLHWPIFAH
jgi:hypothetical protein